MSYKLKYAIRFCIVHSSDLTHCYDTEIMIFVREEYAEKIINFYLLDRNWQDGIYDTPHYQIDSKEKWQILFHCCASVQGHTSLNAHLLLDLSINPGAAILLMNF